MLLASLNIEPGHASDEISLAAPVSTSGQQDMSHRNFQ